MRILLASRNYFPSGVVGGAQVSVKYLAQQLQLQGHDVAVLSLDREEHTGVHEASGVKEYRLKLRNPYTATNAGVLEKSLWHWKDRFCDLMNKDYAQVIEDFKPDVLNTNVMAGIGLGLWNVASSASVPIIHTIHDYYLICIKSSMFAKGTNCQKPCLSCRYAALARASQVTRKVAEVIYVSHHMQQAHENVGLFHAAGKTIIHGTYQPPQNVPVRNGLLEKDKLTLGFFGRISPEKGLNKLIETLRMLPSNSWKLRVGGSGPHDYVEKMKAAAEGLPVEFLGVQSPDAFYASVDAVVVLSLWNDPAPRVAYEAGLHGVIPLVSNRGGLPELVSYGKRGLIFDPEDSTSLKEALLTVIKDPQKVFAFQQNWQKDKKIFLAETVAQETLAVYERAQRSSRK